MDLATTIGLAAGTLLIALTILMGGSVAIFIHIPSLLIVFGGAIAATLTSFKLSEVIGVMNVVRKAFKDETVNGLQIVDFLSNLSKIARKGGLLAIEKEIEKVDDEFLQRGLEMVVDGTEPETIRAVMETELSYLMERHKNGANIFNTLGTYAPAFGMIGTLIGLIAMLQKLDDPSNIGQGMAVALVTTFYGALGANMVLLPISGKLKNRSAEETVLKEMIIEGVLAIQLGEHPNNIKRKLLNFLAPKERGEEAAAA